MNSFVIFLNPTDIEGFTEDQVIINESEYDPSYFDDRADAVKDLIDRLPKREADMIYLYFFKKKYQADIGRIFNVSQGDVSYRIKRGVKRIKFLLEYPEIPYAEMLKDLDPILPFEDVRSVISDVVPGDLDFCGDNLYLRIMVGMYKTSSQSVVAKTLGIYQNRVRYRFLKGLSIIKEHGKTNPKYNKYVHAFEMVEQNPNILRELKIQDRWKHKFSDILV